MKPFERLLGRLVVGQGEFPGEQEFVAPSDAPQDRVGKVDCRVFVI